MRQEFAKNLLKAMEDHPHADTWEIYPEDMPFGWCECEQCQALDEEEPIRFDTIREKDRDAIDPRRMTRRYMYFINDIAKRIRKVYPNKKLAMGAYHRYITPPRDLKPEKNVAVSATITQWYCIKHNINSHKCDENRKYARILDSWLKICPDVYLYEYLWKVIWLDLPYPLYRKVANDYRYYKKVGVTGFRSQGNRNNWGTLGLVYYVAAKMMWNSDIDIEELLNDYFRGFYKEASEPMRKFCQALREALGNAPSEPILSSWIPLRKEWIKHLAQPLTVFTSEVLGECEVYLRKAESVAKDDKVRKRINQARISLEYTKLLTKAGELVQLGYFRELSSEERRRTKEALQAVLKFVDENSDKEVFHSAGIRRALQRVL